MRKDVPAMPIRTLAAIAMGAHWRRNRRTERGTTSAGRAGGVTGIGPRGAMRRIIPACRSGGEGGDARHTSRLQIGGRLEARQALEADAVSAKALVGIASEDGFIEQPPEVP